MIRIDAGGIVYQKATSSRLKRGRMTTQVRHAFGLRVGRTRGHSHLRSASFAASGGSSW